MPQTDLQSEAIKQYCRIDGLYYRLSHRPHLLAFKGTVPHFFTHTLMHDLVGQNRCTVTAPKIYSCLAWLLIQRVDDGLTTAVAPNRENHVWYVTRPQMDRLNSVCGKFRKTISIKENDSLAICSLVTFSFLFSH